MDKTGTQETKTDPVYLDVLEDDADPDADEGDIALDEVPSTKEPKSQKSTVYDASETKETDLPATMLENASDEKDPCSPMKTMDKTPLDIEALPPVPPPRPPSTFPEEEYDEIPFDAVDSVEKTTDKGHPNLSSVRNFPRWRREPWWVHDRQSRSSSMKTISGTGKRAGRRRCFVLVAVGIFVAILIIVVTVIVLTSRSNRESRAQESFERAVKDMSNTFREVR